MAETYRRTGGRGAWVLFALSVAAPILVTLAWGAALPDAAYGQLQTARTIARRNVAGFPPPYALLLAPAARVGLPLLPLSLVLSVLSWVGAIAAWFATGRRLERSIFAVTAALLLALHPLQPQTLGLETSLVLGLWAATAWAAVTDRLLLTAAVGLAMVAIQPLTMAFVTPLLILRLPAMATVTRPLKRVLDWIAPASALSRHWRSIAPVAIGMAAWAAANAAAWSLQGWGPAPHLTAPLLAMGQILAAAVFATLVPHLDWLSAPVLDQRALQRGMAVLALGALLIGQGGALVHAWRLRPTERLSLYGHVADWLAAESLPGETVATAQPGLVSFRSDRPAVALASAASAAALRARLEADRPDHCVALDSVGWDGLRAQPWFQEHYHPVAEFASAYDPATPLTVFRYRPTPFDAGETVTTPVRFASDAGAVELVSYRLESERVTPGEALHLTLSWRADAPVEEPLRLSIELVDQRSGTVWTQVEDPTPADLPTDRWNVGEPYVTRHALWVPADLPPGEYALTLAFVEPNGQTLAAFRGQQRQGDRVALAHVNRPPAVTTQALKPDHTTQFTFGDAIALVGYDVVDRVAPGEPLRVALYWRALETVPLDYKVFIHLTGPEGEIVAQDDNMPVEWTYPTSEWQPGEMIRDEHVLEIEPSTPRGDYVLSVGLYDPETSDRPAVRDAAGEPIPEGQVVLQPIRVR